MVGRLLEIPVSVTPTDAIRALRLVGESHGWSMRRLEESRMVHRFAIIMPLSRMTRVLGIEVLEGSARGLSLRTWSNVPGSAGRITWISIEIPPHLEGDEWKAILDEWSSRLPRCPWQWTFGERSIIGFLLPEYRRSRVHFGHEGIDVKQWTETPTQEVDSALPKRALSRGSEEE